MGSDLVPLSLEAELENVLDTSGFVLNDDDLPDHSSLFDDEGDPKTATTVPPCILLSDESPVDNKENGSDGEPQDKDENVQVGIKATGSDSEPHDNDENQVDIKATGSDSQPQDKLDKPAFLTEDSNSDSSSDSEGGSGTDSHSTSSGFGKSVSAGSEKCMGLQELLKQQPACKKRSTAKAAKAAGKAKTPTKPKILMKKVAKAKTKIRSEQSLE